MAENQEGRKAGLPATTTPEPTNLPGLPTQEGLRVLYRMATFAKQAGIAGQNESLGSITTKLIAAVEEGIGPMQAFKMFYHVPGSSGYGTITTVKIAKFHKAGHHHKVVSNDGETCIIDLYLRGRTRAEERVELTREYCDQRGWTTGWSKTERGVRVTKDNWERDPTGMLFNRTFSFGYRRHCPECEFIKLNEEVRPRVLTEEDMEFLQELKEEAPEDFQDLMRGQTNGQKEVVEGEYEELPVERPLPSWTETDTFEQLWIRAEELDLTEAQVCEALALDAKEDLGRYPASYRIAVALLEDYWEADQRAKEAEPGVEELDQSQGQAPPQDKLL